MNEFWNGDIPYVGFNLTSDSSTKFCKRCNTILQPSKELINNAKSWEKGGARCGNCQYLYFPDYSQTWYKQAWLKDYYEKREKILSNDYSKLDSKLKEIYQLLYFIYSLENNITMYFNNHTGNDYELLIKTLKLLRVQKTLRAAEKAQDIFKNNQLRWKLSDPWNEDIADEVENITDDLHTSIDADFEKLIYFKYLESIVL